MLKFKKIFELYEAFKDLGNLLPSELEKGQKLDSNEDGNFIEVPARVFHKIISKIKQNDLAKGAGSKGLDTLTVYDINEYNDMRCFIGINNSSGYALHHDELVSVFSSQQSSGSAIVQDAIKNGAKRLDCFATREPNGKISGPLYTLYSRNGFKIDTHMNVGKEGEPYSIKNGVSSYVNDNDEVEPDNPSVVIFMKL